MLAAWKTAFVLALLPVLTAAPARAQHARPAPMVHAVIGHAAILGEGPIPHSVFGVGASVFVAAQFAIGPEFLYMRGPGRDRDIFLAGTATIDLRADSQHGRTRRVVPYLVVNGGVTRVSGLEFMPQGKSAVIAPVLSVGGGARIAMGRLFVAPEYRVGIEPQKRFCVAVGWRPGY